MSIPATLNPPPNAAVLVVDDTPQNIRLLEAVLVPRGYKVVPAASGEEALKALAVQAFDLVLLDIQMPGMDGYEVCRRIRLDRATMAIPVVMITASGEQEKVRALEAGADDFVPKPFNHSELLARMRSLTRLKRFYDTIQTQAAELKAWGEQLDARVREQVDQLERLGRLRRFLSPQIAEAVINSGDAILKTHRREIAALFCDLRGFTAFSETAEPEDVMAMLADYHAAVGAAVAAHEATCGDFAGDGVLLYWNDPVPCADPALRAVRLALELQARMLPILERWRALGHELGIGVGIALGYATLGMIGFEGRQQYTPLGSTVNLASRLCGEAAGGEIVINQRGYAAVEAQVEAKPAEKLALKGFSKPVQAYRVTSLKQA